MRGVSSTVCMGRFALLAALAACMPQGDATPVDRSTSPVLGNPENLQLPPVVSKELPNGLQLLMVEHHELPVVNFIMLVKSGPETDPSDRLGLSTLTAAMMDEGAGSRDALAIADQVAFLGATLGTSSGWDASRVSLQTITTQIDSALALFADVIMRPTFPDAELERLRRERLTALIQIQDNPPQIAEIAFARIVFGDAHPYGRPQLGNEKTVASITREDVQGYYRSNYRPNNSTLIVVGDFSPADIEKRITTLFGGWERGEVPQIAAVAPPARSRSSVYLIDKPRTPQASVRVGHVGVARSSPDYFGLAVANTVLGGSFTSRLNMNLREAKAFTYGANSRFDMRETPGPFAARAEIFTTKADSGIAEFMKELSAIRDSIPAAELEKAKQYLQLQLPNAFETPGDIAAQLVPIALYGLPLDYYNTYAQSIGSVTVADAKRVAEAHINPANAAIVVVGDRREIEAALRKLGLGPVEIRDIHGAAVRR